MIYEPQLQERRKMILFCISGILFIIIAMDLSKRIKFSIKNEILRIIIYLAFLICSVLEFIMDIRMIF